MKAITVYLICVITLFLGCKEKSYFKEIISEKDVSISTRTFDNEKIWLLNIPIEFKLNLNHKDIKDIRIYYILDNDLSTKLEDFIAYNGDNNKLFRSKRLENGRYPNSLYIVDRRFNLTEDQVKDFLKKYNLNKELDDLETIKDTIALVPYKQFREDHPQFLQKMRQKPDSLLLSIGFSKGRQEVFRERINW